MARHPIWRERKLRRQQRGLAPANFHYQTSCSCGCSTCKNVAHAHEQEATHLYWRERRRKSPLQTEQAWEILNETPVVHLFSRNGQPVSAIPGTYREFEPVRQQEGEVGVGGQVRLVYVYIGKEKRAKRIRGIDYLLNTQLPAAVKLDLIKERSSLLHCGRMSWQQSEKNIRTLYREKFPTWNPPANRAAFQVGRPNRTTIPDDVLPPSARGMQKMKLGSQKELELVEVKNYLAQHVSGLLNKLEKQVEARLLINTNQQQQGMYQSIVLDFRGQEGNCAEVKSTAGRVFSLMNQIKGNATILVQVLLWKDCPHAC